MFNLRCESLLPESTSSHESTSSQARDVFFVVVVVVVGKETIELLHGNRQKILLS